MNISQVLILASFVLSITGHYLTLENGIFNLNENTFDYAIRDYDYVLVQFTEPTCRKCIDIDEAYRRAGKLLSELKPPIYFAKVDVTQSKKIIERFKVKGFPSFLFFKRGQQTQYYGGRDSFSDFYNWAYKKVFDSVKSISTD